jgi:hypothetical protein
MKKIFSYLNRSNLIEYEQKIGSNGQFEPLNIIVLDGQNFDKNQPFEIEQPVGQKTAQRFNRPAVNSPLLNKEKATKEIKEQNKDSRSTGVELLSDTALFYAWYFVYPRKQKKEAARKIWIKNKLDAMADKIMEHTKACIDGEWNGKDKQFIPLPDTYLRQERFNDDEVLPAIVEKPEKKPNQDTSSLPTADYCYDNIQYGYYSKNFSHPLVYLMLEKIIKKYQGYNSFGRLLITDAQRVVKSMHHEVCQEFLENKEKVVQRMGYYIDNDEIQKESTKLIGLSFAAKKPEYMHIKE